MQCPDLLVTAMIKAKLFKLIFCIRSATFWTQRDLADSFNDAKWASKQDQALQNNSLPLASNLQFKVCFAGKIFYFFWCCNRIKQNLCVCVSHSVVSDSFQPHGPLARFFCPWNFPGKNTVVGSYSLLQGIFLTQGLNSGLLCCRQILYHLSHQGNTKQKLSNTKNAAL